MRKKSVYKKSSLDILKSLFVPVIFTVVMMGMIIYGLRQTEEASSAEGQRILEDSLRRAIVTAYAIEGRYPESIEHIEQRFGIFIDRSRYVVHYVPWASNVMPDIFIFEPEGSIGNW